jgi:hypothetical protein
MALNPPSLVSRIFQCSHDALMTAISSRQMQLWCPQNCSHVARSLRGAARDETCRFLGSLNAAMVPSVFVGAQCSYAARNIVEVSDRCFGREDCADRLCECSHRTLILRESCCGSLAGGNKSERQNALRGPRRRLAGSHYPPCSEEAKNAVAAHMGRNAATIDPRIPSTWRGEAFALAVALRFGTTRSSAFGPWSVEVQLDLNL